MSRARACALGLAALASPLTTHAQIRVAPPPRPLGPRWHLSGSVGLVSRGDQPWTAMYQAVAGTGWDSGFPGMCQFACPRASDYAGGRPAAFGAAARYRLRRHWQLRATVSHAPFGTFRGAGPNGEPLGIAPAVTGLGTQVVFTVRSLWFGGGPALYWNRIEEQAGSVTRTSRSTRLGTALVAGVTWPEHARWYIDAAVERRWVGNVRMQAMSVSGAPNVPSMRVPLKHTALWIGVGHRRD